MSLFVTAEDCCDYWVRTLLALLKKKDHSLARFARAHRGRRENLHNCQNTKMRYHPLSICGPLTLRTLRALREKIVFIFCSP